MKLLELLVKERIEWPADTLKVAQGYDYQLEKVDDQGNSYSTDIYLSKLVEKHRLICMEVPECHAEVVTKEQYDNACKLVDDGYTLWFGGECPVQGDAMLDMVWIHNGAAGDLKPVKASDFPWTESADLIAYKVIGEKPVSIESIRKPFDFVNPYTSVADVVNHPSHYTNGKVECIDAIESATVGKTGIEAVCVANVIKYLWRYEDKNSLEDIKKAQWYLNKLIEVKK